MGNAFPPHGVTTLLVSLQGDLPLHRASAVHMEFTLYSQVFPNLTAGDCQGRDHYVFLHLYLNCSYTYTYNPGLLHCRQVRYHLGRQGSPSDNSICRYSCTSSRSIPTFMAIPRCAALSRSVVSATFYLVSALPYTVHEVELLTRPAYF